MEQSPGSTLRTGYRCLSALGLQPLVVTFSRFISTRWSPQAAPSISSVHSKNIKVGTGVWGEARPQSFLMEVWPRKGT